MKSILFSSISLFALAVLTSFVAPPKGKVTHQVNAKTSTLTWKGEKVTGSHFGYILLKNGTLVLEDNKLVGGSFAIDMNSIECTDLSGGGKAKLVGHLKSDDFFGVATFPEATLNITKATLTAENSYAVTADLTIKGHTEAINFEAKLSTDKDVILATAEIVVDRTKFDIRYGSTSFFDSLGDKAIYDNFTLTVRLSANK